jgi:hypothetical protein
LSESLVSVLLKAITREVNPAITTVFFERRGTAAADHDAPRDR